LWWSTVTVARLLQAVCAARTGARITDYDGDRHRELPHGRRAVEGETPLEKRRSAGA
jgi:hypothetical protein